MQYPIAERLNRLAETLETFKAQVREVMASEMAKAMGAAVRDVVIVVLCDQFATASYRPSGSVYRSAGPVDPYADDGRDEWDEDDAYRGSTRASVVPQMPASAAVAVGVHVGRWVFRKQSSLPLSVGAGLLTTVLGLSGGVATRAILAVVSAGVDLLTADSDLNR